MNVVEQQPFSVNAVLARILSRSNNFLKSFPQPTCSAASPTCEVHVDLPEPPSLLPHLVAAGARLDVAQAIHDVYYRQACKFREHSLATISRACSRLAQIPSCSISSEETIINTFTQLYLKKLDLWIGEGVTMFQSKPSSTSSYWNNDEAVASKPPKSFNHQYVPLLEHFFEENPFPTHADKVFLAKKSDMTYRQIHVWFQNRRNRTKRVLHRKPVSEGTTLPLDTLIRKMGKFAVPPNRHPDSPSSEPTTPQSPHAEVRNVLEGVAPPHAFPTPYRSTCAYDPFPSVPVFLTPEWPRRTMRSSERPPKCVVDVDELIATFSRLNVWDDSFSRSRRNAGKAPGDCHAAVSAITIKPSSAPHPACVRKPIDASVPRTTFQSIRATTSSSRVFGSPSPQSPMATLVPKATRRKLAPLPKRSPHPPFTQHRETFGNTVSSRSFSSSSRSSSFSSQGSFQDASLTFSSPSNSSSTFTTPEISPSPLTLDSDGPDDPSPLFT